MKRLVLLWLICAPAVARAQSRDELDRAKASFQAGATAYAAGEYLAAIQALEAAYAITPSPAIAFSLAQAERRQYFAGHERAHLDRAIALFRQYVDQIPSGGRRADALDALAQLEPLAAVQSAAPGAPAEAVRPARLMITAEAPGARLVLDGAAPVDSPLISEVEPGKHAIAASAPGFFAERREVTAVAGELIPTTLVLRERLGSVTVSAPPEAEIYLDGVYRRRGGLTLELPRGPHHLAVAEKGHRLWSRVLQVERGQTQDVAVTLEPTRQRRAARVLFVASGGALVTGVVLGALALNAESQADDFLARRAAANVGPGELTHYQHEVTARNRERAAAAGAFGVAAGCLVTGFFLYHLDHPDPEQTSRSMEPAEPFTPTLGRRDHLRVLPLVGPGGAVLQVAAGF
jgi:hypothetical protein